MTEAPWRVPLSDIRVDEELLTAARDVLASGWWSMGPRVAELERAFAAFMGVPHALAVSNGTAALHLALLAMGCGPGDEVVLPSLNFVAAANTVARVGATPVFCDVVGDDGPQPRRRRPRGARSGRARRRSSSSITAASRATSTASWTIAEGRGHRGDRGRSACARWDVERPPARDGRCDRVLQLLLEQEPPGRRGRDGRDVRRRARGSGPARFARMG